MELSWSSFILEIINFLVLIWILKHFFYSPIQKAILRRKSTIQANVEQAKSLNDEAHQLEQRYGNRLNDWEVEKAQKKKVYQQELEEWKLEKQKEFAKTLEKEREKIESQENQRVSLIIENNAKESLLIAAKFASLFLKNFADKELEHKIINKVIDDLSNLTADKLKNFKESSSDKTEIVVESAYLISDNQQQQLTDILKKLSSDKTAILFAQNPSILSGLTIQMGNIILQASLRDELKFFAEFEKDHGQ